MAETNQGSLSEILTPKRRNLLLEVGNGVAVWLFRVLLIGVFFWLKAEFLTKDKYLEDQGKQIEQWTRLTGTLTHIDDVLSEISKQKDDQENRLRALEKKK